MLRFVDSVGHYATADITKKYSSVVGSMTVDSGTGRNGGQSLKAATERSYVVKTLDNQVTYVIGFAYKFPTLPTENIGICMLVDGITYQCSLELTPTGTLEIARGGNINAPGTAVTDGESVSAMSVDTWYYVEFKATIADSISANTAQVDVNGSQWVNVATGQDLKITANATADSVYFGTSNNLASSTSVAFFNDLYICDGTGSKNNDFLGDVRVEALFPNGNGATSDFLGSDADKTNNYLLVNDATPDGDSTYVGSSTPTERDQYTFDNLGSTPATDGIHGVVSQLCATKTDAGARTGKNTVRIASTNYDGSAFNPSNGSYQYHPEIWELDPNTAGNWAEAAINSAQFGVLVDS